MPFYRRRYYQRRWRQWRPRYWPRRKLRFRRPRALVRRRRPLYRYKYRVRKRLNRKKKLKYLILKEFQPRKIRKCKIKGQMILFQAGPHRLHREWTNFMTSFYPPHNEGGGGWSQIKFSLESIFEQRELLRNKWTASNVLMPLCRYTGCKFTFFRAAKVDYIVHYSICYPMLTTRYQHTNAQPSNMLFYPKHIIVPSMQRKPHGKIYVKKKIRPPEQFSNKWYFQVDLYKSPLVLITTTAMDLDRWSLNPLSVSNNISITTLNTDFFTNHNFINTGLGTTYWQPKPQYYLYGTLNGSYEHSTVAELIFLGQTRTYTEGNPIGATQEWDTYAQKNKQLENFGNPFHVHYLTKTIGLYISQKPPNVIMAKENRNKKLNTSDLSLAKVDQDLTKVVRYNPERDKGNNKIWLKSTADTIYGWNEPTDEDLAYEGFPLWSLLWGWIDWHIKYKYIQKPEDNYVLVIKTDATYPTYPTLVPLDDTFMHGYSPWQDQTEIRYVIDEENWHPKVKFQERSIENICETGPGTAKTSTQSIEAHAKYCFYFKWGGCPNELENITDPGKQTHWPVPNNELQGPEIQDPDYDYTTDIWPFDIRRHTITKRATERIKKDRPLKIPSFTGSKLSATTTAQETINQIPTFSETPAQEEEKETSEQQQLLQLRTTQQQLRQQLKKILSQTVKLKY
nr:MAG: ORF1 [TTV-like mini virus]